MSEYSLPLPSGRFTAAVRFEAAVTGGSLDGVSGPVPVSIKIEQMFD